MHVCGFHKGTIFTLYKANWQSRKLYCQLNSTRACLAQWSMLILFVLHFQCVPGGGGGGTSTQSTRDGRNFALLPSSHSLPERHAS